MPIHAGNGKPQNTRRLIGNHHFEKLAPLDIVEFRELVEQHLAGDGFGRLAVELLKKGGSEDRQRRPYLFPSHVGKRDDWKAARRQGWQGGKGGRRGWRASAARSSGRSTNTPASAIGPHATANAGRPSAWRRRAKASTA